MKKQILPPTYFFIFLILIICSGFLLPVIKYNFFIFKVLGILLLIFGIAVNIWTDILFKKHKTTVLPFKKSSYFVEEGPVKFTRNPMYLGILSILLGISFLFQALLPVIFTFIFTVLINNKFIKKEEISLEATFGKQFSDYKKRVRRWI